MSQKELLIWHNCLGRLNVKLIQACFKKLGFKTKYQVSNFCVLPAAFIKYVATVLICVYTLRNSWF